MSADPAVASAPLRETVLADLHRSLGARMVPFAGYSMPVQYPEGIMAEHRQTRNSAGLFDVSHMGPARLTGPSYEAVAKALARIAPSDFLALKPGRQRYSLLLTDDGTIIDDLMVTRPADPTAPMLLMVLNAARKEVDAKAIRARLPADVKLEVPDDLAMIALQGPRAVDALARHADVAGMTFMDSDEKLIDGVRAQVSRTGYTGEDGFEIILPASAAEKITRALLAEPEVKPIGLGARDSLRLEAGLPLYGHDIDETTTPVEAGLTFAISPSRKESADFPGGKRIVGELSGGTERVRVGLRIEGRLPAREGATILDAEGQPIGSVTSGGFGPTADAPVAMGYVKSAFAAPGTKLFVKVRESRIPAVVAALPFVPHTYRRKQPVRS